MVRSKPNRRELLLASAGAAALAGCLDFGDDDTDDDVTDDTIEDDATDDDPEEDDPDTDDPDEDDPDEDPIDEEQAATHIENARGELDEAFLLLGEALDDDDVILDRDEFDPHIDAAADELADAEAVASEDQLDEIDGVAAVSEHLDTMATIHLDIEAAFEDEIGEGLGQYWEGREVIFADPNDTDDWELAYASFEDSESAYEDAEGSFEVINDDVATAREQLSAIDDDVFDAFDSTDPNVLDDEIGDMEFFIPEMVAFADGVGDGSRAWTHATAGMIGLVEEDLDDAHSEFGMSESSFNTAVATLEDVDDIVMGAMVTFFEAVFCEIGEGPEAAASWVEAVEAYMDGDNEAGDAALDAGWQQFGECHE